MSRKDRDTIQVQLDSIGANQKLLYEVMTGKAVKLEQAKECLESQLRLKQAVLEQITEERDALRTENKRLEQERAVIFGKTITCSNDHITIKDLTNDATLCIGRDYIDIIYPDGKKVSLRPREPQT